MPEYRTRREFVFRDMPLAAISLSLLAKDVYAQGDELKKGLEEYRKEKLRQIVESDKEVLEKINIVNVDNSATVVYSNSYDFWKIREMLSKYKDVKDIGENIPHHRGLTDISNISLMGYLTGVGALSCGLLGKKLSRRKLLSLFGVLAGGSIAGSLTYYAIKTVNATDLPMDGLVKKLENNEKVSIIYSESDKSEIDKLEEFLSIVEKSTKVEKSSLYDLYSKELV